MLFHFLNLYVEKIILVKAVACTMIFITASTMRNLSLNSQNLLFSCSGIRLLVRFLVFHPIIMIFFNVVASNKAYFTHCQLNIYNVISNKRFVDTKETVFSVQYAG